MKEAKKYALPSINRIVMGIVFLFIGLILVAIDFIFDDWWNFSLTQILKKLLINFDDFTSVLGSSIFLFLRIIIIGYGIKLIRQKSEITLVEINPKQIKYIEAPQSRYDLFNLVNSPKSIELKTIKSISLHSSLFIKNVIQIELNDKKILLNGVNSLSLNQKNEIVEFINTQIKENKLDL